MAKTIRLKCDVGNVSCSSMVDQMTRSFPMFVCSDDATIDVGFFKNGRISEDVKEFKRAELYLKETAGANVNYFIKSVSEINADLTASDWAAGKKHLSFSLDSVDTNVAKGKKWLAVALYYGDYGKSTYIAGDVYFVPSGTENQDVSEPEISNLKNEILSITKSVTENVNAINSAVQSVNEKVLDAETYKSEAVKAASDALDYKNQAEQSAQSASAADSSALQSARDAAISSQSANSSAESAATSEKNAQISLSSCEDIERNLELLSENVEGTKVDIENQLNTARALAIEAGNSASKALDSATVAENASIAAQSALSQIGEIKIDIDEVSENIETAKTEAVAAVEAAAQSGITEVDAAKTEAVGEISAIKSEVETAGANAVNEVNTAKAEAKTEIAADLANAKSEIDTWSDQTERFAKNEADISALTIDKLNRGALWFNKAKLTTATNNATTLPLTLCATVECDDWLTAGENNFGATAPAFFNTHYVSDWSTTQFKGFCFGLFRPTTISSGRYMTLRIANADLGNSFSQNGVPFPAKTGKHTLCVSVSDVSDFAVNFYEDGALLGSGNLKPVSMPDAIGGTSGINIATVANYASQGGQTLIPNLKLSRLKIFNCVLPATKADDTGGIGYTVEDYHNGVDEPPTMQDGGATYRALLSLQDYTITNGSTQQVFDVSGNANDATATLSDGGSLKGSNDISVGRLIDFIKGQSA